MKVLARFLLKTGPIFHHPRLSNVKGVCTVSEDADGWKLPVEYENYAGGVELVLWLRQKVPR